MRLIVGTLTAVGIAVAAPVAAQAQAGIHVGMQVTDPAGGLVGTVTAVDGANLKIKTDKHEILLPQSSFTVAGAKLLFSMTRAQLDSTIEQSLAAANAAVVAGATVKGASGAAVGTIESIADGKVTIALQGGKKLQIDEAGVRGNTDGTVTIGYTQAQLDAMVQQTANAGASAGQ